MDRPLEETIRRVQKLLALGDKNRGATESEAATAMELARKLMTENDLSMTDVQVQEVKKEGAVITNSPIDSHCVPWERTLASAVAALFDCYTYRTRVRWTGKPFSMRFIGVKQDAAICAAAYLSMHQTVENMGKSSPYRGADQRTYMLGVASRLRDRATVVSDAAMEEMKKSEEACRSLTVIKHELIEEIVATLGLSNTRRGNIGGSRASYDRGYAAGGSVNLNFRQSLT